MLCEIKCWDLGRHRARTCHKRRRGGVTLLAASATRTAKEGERGRGSSRTSTTTPLPRPFVSFASHNLTRGRERKKARVERYNGHDLDGRKSIALFSLPPFVLWSVRPSVLLPDSSLFVRPLALSFARSTVACLLLLSLPSPTFYPHGITQKYTRPDPK